VQLIVNIIVLAAIYALLACGYVLIYRVSRVMNMAHGELSMLGAYLLFATASLFATHPLTAIASSAIMSIALGTLVYVLLMRKMTGEMVLAAILTTIAIGILLRGLIVLVWSAAQQHPLEALHLSNPPIEIVGGARISTCAALLVLMTALVYGGLFTFLRFGRWGVRMRAAGQNALLASQRGINLHAIYALASGLDQTMVVIGLKAFAPALVGGLDSLLGALAGAFIVAGAEVLAIHYIDPLLSDVVPFLVIIATLIVRPWGLFGTQEELDRV